MLWLAGFNKLGLVQAYRGFCQRVVECVADGADRGVDAGLVQVLGEPERRVLAAGVGMVHKFAFPFFPVVVSLVQSHGVVVDMGRHGGDEAVIAATGGVVGWVLGLTGSDAYVFKDVWWATSLLGWVVVGLFRSVVGRLGR